MEMIEKAYAKYGILFKSEAEFNECSPRMDGDELTMSGWESNGDFADYFKIGNVVSEEIYWHFLECLPPETMGPQHFQVGEAYDHNENDEPTFSTFITNGEGKHIYMGYLTVKECEEKMKFRFRRNRDEV